MSVMNFQIPKVLDGFGYLRTEFVRDDDVDKAERDHLAAGIRDSVTEYSTAEDEIFQLVQSKLGGLNDDALDEQESPDHLVTMGGMFIDGESSGVMRGSVTVDAAGEASEAMRRALRRKAGEEHTVSGVTNKRPARSRPARNKRPACCSHSPFCLDLSHPPHLSLHPLPVPPL